MRVTLCPCQEVHAEATGELGEQVSNLFHQNSSVSADSNISIIEELQNSDFRLAKHSRYANHLDASVALTAMICLACHLCNSGHASRIAVLKDLVLKGIPMQNPLLLLFNSLKLVKVLLGFVT